MTQDTGRLSITHFRNLARHSFECYRDSYQDAFNIHEYYHGRQLSAKRIENMNQSKIPHLYENNIKKFANLIGGNFKTVVNTVKITAQRREDVLHASILNSLVNWDFRRNSFDTDQGQEVILQGILTGLFIVMRMPVDTGERDEFGRPKYGNVIEPVPVYDIILDPNSSKFDYSDAEWVMRTQWLSENQLRKSFPNLSEDDIAGLPRGGNSIGGDTASDIDTYTNNTYDSLNCGNSDKFHLVHTIIVDGETEDENGSKIDKVWSIYWCGDVEVERKEVSYREVKFPYQIFKLHNEDTEYEFYGLFRDSIGHQDAINNAFLALHRLIGTGKKLVGPKAFKDLNQANREFTNPNNMFVQAEKMDEVVDLVSQADVNHQISTIEFHRRSIESQLGINPAFLGVAAASDSGRKVEIQRQSTVTALNRTESRVQQFYRQLARDLCHFISQYYTFHDIQNVADADTADEFIEINRPVELLVDSRTNQTIDIQQTPQGVILNGELVGDDVIQELLPYITTMKVFEKARDPASGKEILDDDGRNVYAPIPTSGTEIRYFKHNIIVDTAIYDNEKEIAMQLAQNVFNSTGGQLLAQTDPRAFMLAFAELTRGLKTKATNKVADVLEAAANNAQPPNQALGSSAKPTGDNNGN